MNNIDALFGKALDVAVPETWQALNMDQLNKLKDEFAKLIVQECIDICQRREEVISEHLTKQINEHAVDSVKDFSAGVISGSRRNVQHIKQHFGIEL